MIPLLAAGKIESGLAKARAEGRSHLLLCFDSYDRLGGARDGAYYCRPVDDVAAALAALQTGAWNARDGRDFCVGVIDVTACGDVATDDDLVDAASWLATRRDAGST